MTIDSPSLHDIHRWYCNTLASLLQTQQQVFVCFSGGSSLDSWYQYSLQHTAELTKLGICDRVFFSLADERCVPADERDRNDLSVMHKYIQPLVDQNIIQASQFPCFGGEVSALRYNEITPPIPDIALLGVGEDGHIASLFPGHPALHATMTGYVTIYDAPKLPPKRITLTPISLSSIQHTALFFIGETKQCAYHSFLGDASVETCPAKLITPSRIFHTF